MKSLILFTVLVITFHIGENANILIILPLVAKSHFNMFRRLLNELTERGHELDVVSHFPLEKPHARYNDLSLKGTLPMVIDNLTANARATSSIFLRMEYLLQDIGPRTCEPILNSDTARALKNSSKKYDVLITHYVATNCMLGFAYIFQIPTIGIITSVNLPWTSSFMGLPDNPSYIPNFFTPYVAEMSVLQRTMNTITNIVSNIRFSIYNKNINEVARKFFGPTLPDLDDLARNISLMFVNSHFSIHQSRPVPPNFIEIAGVHIDDNVTLSPYFQEALSTDTNGIILLSFGSNLKSDSLPEDKLKAFFKMFKQLRYKILWKGNKDRFPKHMEISNNIQFEPWIPQLNILCHPNVKLFISHGGMLGTLEALYCGIPVLGIPMFGDQFLNIRNTVSKGIAIEVPYERLTENTLMSAANELLNNPKYRINAEKLSKLFKDRPISALETAIYWIEYIIRHNGAPHLRSVGADLPWYQYYLVDVVGVLVSICLIITYLLYKFLSFIYLYFVPIVQQLTSKNKKD